MARKHGVAIAFFTTHAQEKFMKYPSTTAQSCFFNRKIFRRIILPYCYNNYINCIFPTAHTRKYFMSTSHLQHSYVSLIINHQTHYIALLLQYLHFSYCACAGKIHCRLLICDIVVFFDKYQCRRITLAYCCNHCFFFTVHAQEKVYVNLSSTTSSHVSLISTNIDALYSLIATIIAFFLLRAHGKSTM